MRKTELITALTPGAPPMTVVVGTVKNTMHLTVLNLLKLIYKYIVSPHYISYKTELFGWHISVINYVTEEALGTFFTLLNKNTIL